ncbi:MAG: HEAT repeat domain-containing protein [Candidatus Wallbacteria bacterium]|nr:HEAT repeat domain-containing protein [Candidatus Wallbacteria bacterium]
MATVRWAIRAGFDAGLQALEEAAAVETSADVMVGLASALGRLGGSIQVLSLERLLRHLDARVRATAVEALAFLEVGAVYEVAVEALFDTDDRVKSAAARLLSSVGRPATLAVLQRMLVSAHRPYQEAAAHILRTLPPGQDVLEVVLAGFQAAPVALRPRFVITLNRHQQVGFVLPEAVASWLRRQDSRHRTEPRSSGLGRAGSTTDRVVLHALESLEEVLANGTSMERREAVRVAAACACREFVEPLLRHLEGGGQPGVREEDPTVRAAIASALGRLGGPGCVPVLVRQLMDENSRVVASAVEALGAIGDPSTYELLWELRNHPQCRVAVNVAVALCDVEGYDVRPILQRLAHSSEPNDRRAARWGLEHLKRPDFAELLADLEATEAREQVAALSAHPTLDTQERIVRVFVSSTFRDMQAERDILVKEVFPQLRGRCREKGWDLVEVDLRWGITHEDTEKALTICLQEIDRCPLFVGLLGQRYGWVPAEQRTALPENHEWISMEPPRTHSVTALEMLHGALRSSSANRRAFFYLRDSSFLRDPKFQQEVPHRLPGESPAGETQEDFCEEVLCSVAKLEKLKQQIRVSGLSVLDGYACRFAGYDTKDGKVLLEIQRGSPTAEEAARRAYFPDRVLADLSQALDELLPRDTPGEFELERQRHEAFIREGARHHVGRRAELESLTAHAAGSGAGMLVVTGPPGCGKSALLGAWVSSQRQSRADTLVLSHFVGASADSTRADRLMRRLHDELRARLDLPGEFPKDPREMAEAFAIRLAEAAKKVRLVLVIDGLNQLDAAEAAQDLRWLPNPLPPGVRAIAGTTEGRCLEVLRSQRQPELKLRPLADDDNRQIARDFLMRYRKRLSEKPQYDAMHHLAMPSQLDALIQKARGCTVLYLRVALEELRQYGSYEKVGDWIERLPDNEEGLFRQILGQIESEVQEPPELVTRSLSLLAASRHGLSEPELLGMLTHEHGGPMPRAYWSPLYLRLEPYLIHRGELLGFFHQQIEQAVRSRYLQTSPQRANVHLDLATYFVQKANPPGLLSWSGDVRSLREAPYHLLQATREDSALMNDVYEVLRDLDFVSAKCSKVGPDELKSEYDSALALGSARGPVREVLRGLSRALGLKAHRLRDFPERAMPELYNQAAWHDRPAGPLFRLMQEWRERVQGSGRPWLRCLHAPSTPLFGMLLRTMAGHSADVTALAVTADGRVISGSEDGSLVVWDLETGRQRAILTGHEKFVTTVVVTAGGQVVSASGDRTVRIWNLETGRELATLRGHEDAVTSLLLTGDGRVVSGSADRTVWVWDLETGCELATLVGHTDAVTALARTAPGHIVSGSADNTLKLWDAKRGRELATLEGHTAPVTALVPTQDSRLVSASADHTLIVWDLGTDNPIGKLSGHKGPVTAVALTQDGRVVSASADRSLKVWELKTARELASLEGHRAEVLALALTGDGQAISASADRTLKVWELSTGRELASLEGHARRVTAVAVTDDGRAVSSSQDKLLKVWNLRMESALATVRGHVGEVRALAVTGDGRAVSASADKTLRVWHVTNGWQLAMMRGHTSWVTAVVLTGDGRAVSGAMDRTVMVWDLTTGEALATLAGHSDSVECLILTETGRLVSSSADKTLKVWDLDSYRELATLRGHDSSVGILLPLGDNRVLSGSANGVLGLWRVDCGEQLRMIDAHVGPVTALAGMGGSWVVSASADKTARVWDFERGQDVALLGGHTRTVTALAHSDDGRLATGSADHTIKLWATDSWLELASLTGHSAPVTGLVFVSGGRLVSASEDGTVKVWDVGNAACECTLDAGEPLACLAGSSSTGCVIAGGRRGSCFSLELCSPTGSPRVERPRAD